MTIKEILCSLLELKRSKVKPLDVGRFNCKVCKRIFKEGDAIFLQDDAPLVHTRCLPPQP